MIILFPLNDFLNIFYETSAWLNNLLDINLEAVMNIFYSVPQKHWQQKPFGPGQGSGGEPSLVTLWAVPQPPAWYVGGCATGYGHLGMAGQLVPGQIVLSWGLLCLAIPLPTGHGRGRMGRFLAYPHWTTQWVVLPQWPKLSTTVPVTIVHHHGSRGA